MTSEARTETSCCQAPISFMTYAIDKAHRLSLFSFLVFMSYSIECRLIHVERLYALRHLHLWSLVVSACMQREFAFACFPGAIFIFFSVDS